MRHAAPPAASGTGELEGGLVTASRRRHYAVLLDSGASLECLLKGRTTTLACGDRVRVARMAGGGSIETGGAARDAVSSLRHVQGKADRRQRYAGRRRRRAGSRRRRGAGQPLDHRRRDPGLPLRAGRQQVGPARLRRAPRAHAAICGAGLCGRAAVGEARHRAAPPVSARASHRAHRPVGDGQVHDPQRHRAARAGEDGGGLGGAVHRPPHDLAVDAVSVARRRRRRLGRRFARAQGVRPRARRARNDRGEHSSRSVRCWAIAGSAIAATIASLVARCGRRSRPARWRPTASRCCSGSSAKARRCACRGGSAAARATPSPARRGRNPRRRAAPAIGVAGNRGSPEPSSDGVVAAMRSSGPTRTPVACLRVLYIRPEHLDTLFTCEPVD